MMDRDIGIGLEIIRYRVSEGTAEANMAGAMAAMAFIAVASLVLAIFLFLTA